MSSTSFIATTLVMLVSYGMAQPTDSALFNLYSGVLVQSQVLVSSVCMHAKLILYLSIVLLIMYCMFYNK